MVEKTRLGTSQRAVIAFMKGKPPLTAQEIGDALYEKTSSCFIHGSTGRGSGYWNTGKAKPHEVRRAWASKILNTLKKKKIIYPPDRNFYSYPGDNVWFLTEEGNNVT